MRHYSRATEKAYVSWSRRFILFHRKRHPAEMGRAEVESFLSALAVKRCVSPATQNQALCALLFLYRDVLGRELGWLEDVVRAKTRRRLPVVFTRQEVGNVLDELRGTHRLMAALLYGSGLRLQECCTLRIKDLDFSSHQILVRGGKGDKDRMTLLPTTLGADLHEHLGAVDRLHLRDLDHDAGWVALPGALHEKYPNAGRQWCWQWVFPATRIYVDRPTGQRRRHHLHESVLQRAVREAVIRSRVAKPGSCHTFRHYPACRVIPPRGAA